MKENVTMKSYVTTKDAFQKLSKDSNISLEAQKSVTRLGSPMTIKNAIEKIFILTEAV